MYTTKEKLMNALGAGGAILWYIISIFYSIAPLFILRFPSWVDIVLIIVMTCVPFLGEIVRTVLFVWAIFAAVSQPLSIITIIFFVFAIIYVLTEVIPFIFNLWDAYKSK